MTHVLDVQFERGHATLDELDDSGIPEIAFIGRSNVGKSTLINRVTRRKKLAKTSGQPGKTQELNFYLLRLRLEDGSEQKIRFVDLPGFGFAKFSKKKREYLSRLTVEYVDGRGELKAICLLNDCRRLPENDELALRDVAADAGVHVLTVVTKLDKLKKSERVKTLRAVASAYTLEPDDLLLTGEKEPVERFWERLLPLIDS